MSSLSFDATGQFATCHESLNDYMGTMLPNFFMGPTLYNSDPSGGNTVNREGAACSDVDECFFLHADMLHEAPRCVGMAHDPETATAYGAVFWAFDSFLEQLVRLDFQQPHGPGSMDHSIATVRRFADVRLRGDGDVHAGMAVDAASRTLTPVSHSHAAARSAGRGDRCTHATTLPGPRRATMARAIWPGVSSPFDGKSGAPRSSVLPTIRGRRSAGRV